MAEDNLFGINTVSYDEFVNNLELLQRPKRALKVNFKIKREEFDFFKIHALFASGYIDRNQYRDLLNISNRNQDSDIKTSDFFNIINNYHQQHFNDETLVPIQLDVEDLYEILLDHLNNDNFTILVYVAVNPDEYEYETACLILKEKNDLKVINFTGESKPVISDMDDLFENNDDEITEFYLFGIDGRKQFKRELKDNILRMTSKLPSGLSSYFGKEVYDYSKREYSPKRKVKKSPKRKVKKSSKRKVKKSPKRKVIKSPKRKVKKSPKRN